MYFSGKVCNRKVKRDMFSNLYEIPRDFVRNKSISLNPVIVVDALCPGRDQGNQEEEVIGS